MNFRKLSAKLNDFEIQRLGAAQILASRIGSPLNCYVRFSPFDESNSAPRDAADAFVTLRNYIRVWVPRNCGCQLVSMWAVYANPEGSRPHLNYFLHIPSDEKRAALAAALRAIYRSDEISLTADIPFYPRGLTGPFIGYRSGMTRNINTTATKKHFQLERRAGISDRVAAN